MHTESYSLTFGSALAAKGMLLLADSLPVEFSWIKEINQLGASGLLLVILYFFYKDRNKEKAMFEKNEVEMHARHEAREQRLIAELKEQRDKHESLLREILELRKRGNDH